MPLAAEGEFALARQHLVAPGAVSHAWFGQHHFHAVLADVAARQRDSAALRQYAAVAEASAARHGHALYQAIAHRAWGVLHRLEGDHAKAEARLRLALELFLAVGTRWQIGRTYMELGEVARADRRLARSHFEQALALFEAMGAIPDAERARQALADL